MNVEQRHDTERNISLGKRVSVRDIRRRNRQIEMPQGHALGASRASARVQYQRNVVGRRLGCGGSAGSADHADVALFVHLHGKYGNLAVRRGGAHEFGAHGRTQQNTGIGVSRKEMKLFIGIGGVQGGCSPSDRSSEEN